MEYKNPVLPLLSRVLQGKIMVPIGLNNCGKGTQCKSLVEEIQQSGFPAIYLATGDLFREHAELSQATGDGRLGRNADLFTLLKPAFEEKLRDARNRFNLVSGDLPPFAIIDSGVRRQEQAPELAKYGQSLGYREMVLMDFRWNLDECWLDWDKRRDGRYLEHGREDDRPHNAAYKAIEFLKYKPSVLRACNDARYNPLSVDAGGEPHKVYDGLIRSLAVAYAVKTASV